MDSFTPDDAAPVSFKPDEGVTGSKPKIGGEFSKTRSVLRGAGQGLTLGFADEITGALEAVGGSLKKGSFDKFTDLYRQSRDEARQLNREAQEANPMSYFAGEIGGSVASSFVPGGVVAKGLGLAANTARGASIARGIGNAALMGGVSSLGASESTTIGGDLYEAGKGALIGGAVAGAVGKVVKGSANKAVRDALGDVTDGARYKLRDKLLGAATADEQISKQEELYKFITKVEPQIAKGARKGGKEFLDAVETGQDRWGPIIGQALDQVDQINGGVQVTKIVDATAAVRDDLMKKPSTLKLGKAMDKKIDDMIEAWVDVKKKPEYVTEAINEHGTLRAAIENDARARGWMEEVRIPARAVRENANNYWDELAGTDNVTSKVKIGEQAGRDLYGALTSVVDDEVVDTAKQLATYGKGRALDTGIDLASYKEAAKNYSMLKDLRRTAEAISNRDASPSTRLKDRVSGGVDMVLGAQAIAGNPSLFIAKKAVELGGVPAIKATRRGMDKLLRAADSGDKRAIALLRLAMLSPNTQGVGGAALSGASTALQAANGAFMSDEDPTTESAPGYTEASFTPD
jgi:hypothetical protein